MDISNQLVYWWWFSVYFQLRVRSSGVHLEHRVQWNSLRLYTLNIEFSEILYLLGCHPFNASKDMNVNYLCAQSKTDLHLALYLLWKMSYMPAACTYAPYKSCTCADCTISKCFPKCHACPLLWRTTSCRVNLKY